MTAKKYQARPRIFKISNKVIDKSILTVRIILKNKLFFENKLPYRTAFDRMVLECV